MTEQPTASPPDAPEVMTLPQVAEYLQLSPRTIAEWRKDGRIPFVRLGVSLRFPRVAIDEWLAERTRKAVR